MRLLTLDTGKNQSAYAITCITDNDVVLEDIGVIPAVYDLTKENIQQNIANYDKNLQALCDNIDTIVFERVIQRPTRTSGSSVEYIGIGVGVLLARCQDHNILAIPTMASVWKTKLRKIKPWTTSSEIFNFPPIVKARKSNMIADHEFDAASIALWFIQKNTEHNVEHVLTTFTDKLHDIYQTRRTHNAK